MSLNVAIGAFHLVPGALHTVTMIESATRQIVYALRGLARNPFFTAMTVLTLAVGIGGTTAVFSLVHTLILGDLPVRNPSELVEPLSLYPGDPRINSFGLDYYEYLRDRNTVFSDLTGISGPVGAGSDEVRQARVLGNFFSLLGVDARIGRLIEPGDARPGSPRVAVLEWSYWQRRYGGDPGVIGESIVVGGTPATIIGVTGRGFFGLQVGVRTDVWVPFPGGDNLALLGRLRPGVSLEEAQAEMSVLDRWRVEGIASRSGDPLWEEAILELEDASGGFSRLRDEYQSSVLVLMAIVALLLLLACANIAGLLLARASDREREMALRVALGAGRLRLWAHLLTEPLLLSIGGAIPGTLLAYAGARALVRILTSGRPLVGLGSIEVEIAPDLGVLLFTTGVALATGLFCGLVPAIRAAGMARVPFHRQPAGAGGTHLWRFGGGLVAAEVALSVILLSTAGLLGAHLGNLRTQGLGFEPDSVLLVGLAPEGDRREELSGPYRDLLGRLRELPGARSVALASHTPIAAGAALRFAQVGDVEENLEDRRYLWLRWVGPDYFETLEIPLLRGRDFEFRDAGGPLQAVVSESMARYYFGESDPLGESITFEGEAEAYRIIGVAGDAKYAELDEPAPRAVYLHAFQGAAMSAHQLVIRTEGPPLDLAQDVRRIVGDTVPGVSVRSVTTLNDQVDASIVPDRLMAFLAAVFAGLGVFLAAIGLFGLLAYTLARRTREIGIRVALGATRTMVIIPVLGESMKWVLAGAAGGGLASFGSHRLVRYLVEGLSGDSLIQVGSAILLVAIVALIATAIPAHRASSVEPMVVLRHE